MDIREALRPRAAAPAKPSAAAVWAAQRDVEEFSKEWSQLMWDQVRLGGKVYRANPDRIEPLRKRIDTLNRKAAKLGAQPISLQVTDERDQEIFTTDEGDRVADWNYVVLGGSGPVVPGYVFLAALDHTVDGGEGDPKVAIRRVPSFAAAHDLSPEETARLSAVDFDAFRHAENRCEHCGFKRRRNTTYLVLEKDTGRVMQVGSDCLGDFTGATSPEKMARWAELLAALDSDMETEGSASSVADTTRAAISTLDYLAHAAACARAHGWRKRWVDGQRGHGTADDAHANLAAEYTPVTDADREVARKALEWAREDLADRPGLSEFEHNMTTYAAGDYLGAKGDGTLAYLPQAYLREQQRAQRQQTAATSEYVGQPKERLKGLELEVTMTRFQPGNYGRDGYFITKLVDADGNQFLWYGSRELQAGSRYSMAGTVKRHELDRYTQAKTTVLTNCRQITELAATP